MKFRQRHGKRKTGSRLAAMRRIAGPRNSRLATRNSQLATRNSQLATRNSQLATRNSPRDRRGILLLVVLSLLVLFLLVGTSYVVSSNQYRKANKTLGKPYAPAKSPLQHTDLLEEVVNQLVRDTTNEFSSLRYHSLLRDLYGSDGFFFELPADGTGSTTVTFAPNTDGQFIRIDMQFNTTPTLRTVNGYYNGLVLTTADGIAGGQSSRIVNYRFDPVDNPGAYRFEIMRFEDFTGLPGGGDRVVINGRPFNGTGVGYNPNGSGTARLSALERFVLTTGATRDESIALMPNAAFFDPNNVVTTGYFVDPNNPQRSYVGQGGADESYDAVDFQNMALALSPVSPIETLMPSLEPGLSFDRDNLPPQLGNVVLPSFHRPALINYWHEFIEPSASVELASEPSLLRKIMLRPNWVDHPNFTGSNPEYAQAVANKGTEPEDPLLRMIYGPWDVDNDSDGRRDSVWVDFGAPVMMGPQGKLVKPLAAILCVDLDGRLNLNAHGTRQLAEIDGMPPAQNIAGSSTSGVMSDQLPRGQGYGPAEISLEPVVGDVLFRRLLQGMNAGDQMFTDSNGDTIFADRDWSGRYGLFSTDGLPGFVGSYDLLAQLKQQGLPQRADSISATAPQKLGNYATPPDLFGRYITGLNDLGQPVYEVANDEVDLDQDSPYELNLSRVGPVTAGDSAKDGPFSLAEMERILRAYDADAGKLPARLWELANRFRTATSSGFPDINELNEWRTLLTTDSFDLPVPNVLLPEWMRVGPDGEPGVAGVDDDGNLVTDDGSELGFSGSDDFAAVMLRQPVNLSFVDLITYRVLQAKGLTATPASIASIQGILSQLMAPELADGLRLDLNRPFGNGRDDNGNGMDDDSNGQTDEPGEVEFDTGGNFAGVVGVVDEPGEEEGAAWRVDVTRTDAKEAVASTGSFTNSTTGTFRDNFDRNGDGMIDASDGFASRIDQHNFRRQLFARHLYVLAMTLVDPLPSGASQEDREKRARQLAQWAINVADFRDPDNIMTAFEYDVNPFNGWDVDGNVNDPNDIYGADKKFGGTDDVGGVVWGAERPELLITETLAWHDRNTSDTGLESVNSLDEPADEEIGDGIGDVRSGDDMTHDQEYRPEGAAFIELYNPWPAETAANADTHAVDANGNDLGIDLAKTHNNNTSTGSPVWRMMVYRGGAINLNPDDPDTAKRPNNIVWQKKRTARQPLGAIATIINQKADRSIYFTDFDPADRDGDGTPDDSDGDGPDWDGDDGVAFFSPSNIAGNSYRVPSVRPGRYMVVAGVDTKRQETNPGEFLVKYGRHARRGIRLKTDPTATDAVSVLDTEGAPLMDMEGFPVQSPAEDERFIPKLAGDTNASVASVAIIGRAAKNRFYSREGQARRFTFTEPAGGYPDVVPLHNSRTVIAAPSGWNKALGKYTPVMDRPLDERRFFDPDSLNFDPDARLTPERRKLLKNLLRRYGNAVASPTSLNDGETRLVLPEDTKGIRTIPGFCWVYLQRLANPLQPWNPEPFLSNGQDNPKHNPDLAVNLYRTLDVSGVNVTVFNGRNKEERQWPEDEPRRSSSGSLLQPKVYSNRDSAKTFASVQRGRVNDPTRPIGDYMYLQDRALSGLTLRSTYLKNPHDPILVEPVAENLWSPEPIEREAFWTNRGGPRGLGREEPRTESNFDAVPDCSLGFLNENFRNANEVDTDRKRVVPENPFPWFTWNNRSYVSSGELLQVPKYSMVELPRAFSFAGIVSPLEQYDGDTKQVAPDDFELDGPYSHLMNYFRVKAGDGVDMLPNTQDDEGIVGLYRVLDYVGVPSRYVGTETWLNPASFSGDPNSVEDPRYLRQPPFNKISAYRDPGRVNLNTIVDHRVWDGGILHRELPDPNNPWNPTLNNYDPNSGHLGPLSVNSDDAVTFNPDFLSGRRGHVGDLSVNASVSGTTDSMLLLDSNVPTFFANPFRAANAGDLVPLVGMQRHDVDCTTLRRQMYSPGLDGLWGDPFVDDDMNGITDDLGEAGMGTLNDDVILDAPLFASGLTGTGNQHHDAARNAYFRYQPMTRLSELTTTRSNVYAVWITIGFFEVEEADRARFDTLHPIVPGVFELADQDALFARVYPEGYQLGREMGSDTGEFERLREFAIIDRSIPVAFEPGEDHNVERAVRLRRRIE